MAKTKKILTLNVATPLGDLVLSAKAGEDPEFKAFAVSIEDSDDALSNDGEMIFNQMIERTYVQGVFLYRDEDVPKLQSLVELVSTGDIGGVPANLIWTDGSIYSNTGVFVGGLIYNGTGTQELKFASGKDWIIT
jgi:hypothetical protein